MLKCWAQFWSTFQTLKNQFEQWSGRFVVPEPALKMGPQNQAKTKKQETPKKCEQHKTKRFFLQNGAFSENIENLFLMALGCWLFCGQRPVMTTAKNTTKQGVLLFFCCVFLVVVAPTKQQTNKQQPSKQEQATTTKQQSWDPEFKRTKNQTHSKKRQQHQTQRGKTL